MSEKIQVKNLHSVMYFDNDAILIFEDKKGFTKDSEIPKKKFLKFLNNHIEELMELVK